MNNDTSTNVHLMFNASRIITYEDDSIQYVSDVFLGQRNDGSTYKLDTLTALSNRSLDTPIIPIGLDSSLDFWSSMFTITQQSEMEMYQSEISTRWLRDHFDRGFISVLMAAQEDISDFIFADSRLLDGGITEGFIADGEWTA